jgi:hypothetical protein
MHTLNNSFPSQLSEVFLSLDNHLDLVMKHSDSLHLEPQGNISKELSSSNAGLLKLTKFIR